MKLLQKKRELDFEDEEKDCDRERIIAVYTQKKRIIFKVELITDLFYILKNLSLPYFYSKSKKVFFNYDKNISFFWDNKDNKIIYESKKKLFITKDVFYGFHKNQKPENIKKYYDFCSPEYYFYEEDDKAEEKGEDFINTLNEQTIVELKHTRYFNEKKIIRFFGPKKNGKSTLVYYYFSMRRYIPFKQQKSIDDMIKEIITNQSNIDNLNENEEYLGDIENIFNDKNYYLSEEYSKDLKREDKLEANSDIPLLDNDSEKKIKIFSFSIAEIDSETNKKYLTRENNKIIFEKEFSLTRNDSIGFFRSCYLNNDFLKSKENSSDLKFKTLYYEFQGLFKSYNVYKLFINKFEDFKKDLKNIIGIGHFILDFMRNYNKNFVRYFIIFDSISDDLINDLEIFEKEARKDENCFIIELFKNEKLENLFYDNVIESKIEDDILSLYCQNYSNLSLVKDLNENEKSFLINNFGQNLYYYQKFKKWKSEGNLNLNNFILINNNEVKNELLKAFANEDEGRAFYRFISLIMDKNEMINEKIIKRLNLDYFYIEKGKDSLKLMTMPFIKQILNEFKNTPINSLLYTDFFKNCDEFIKGGILEDIAKEQIKAIFKSKAKNPNDYQEINILRLLDNEIYTFYEEDNVKNILNKKKKYQKIKELYEKKNLKLENKITILNEYQNAKHYDLAVLFYGQLFLFQSTINKKNDLIKELINFLLIDINYITIKIRNLTEEKNIVNKIYCYFIIANMESIYENTSNILEYKKMIFENNKNNLRMEKLINNSKFNLLYLGKEGKIYNRKMDLVSEFIPNNKYEIYENILKIEIMKNKLHLIYQKFELIRKIKESENIPSFINKKSISFFSLYYPKIEKPNNIIYYYEFQKIKISFFVINNKFYDFDLNPIEEKSKFIEENKAAPFRIFLFKYDKI